MKNKHFHRGKISQPAIDGFKLKLEQTLSDPNFNIGRHRNAIMQELAPTLDPDHLNRWLKIKLLEIAKRLPSSGRLSYDSDNMNLVRPYIDDVTVRLLSGSPAYTDLKKFLQDFDELTKRRCAAQNISDAYDYFLKDKIIADLYCRLGNRVIQAALAVRKQKDHIHAEKGNYNKLWRRDERKKLSGILNRHINILPEVFEQTCNDSFAEYLKKLRKFERENEHDNDDEMEREEMEM